MNRAIADNRLDGEVDEIASRVALFGEEALARTKRHAVRFTLPPDGEFPPAR